MLKILRNSANSRVQNTSILATEFPYIAFTPGEPAGIGPDLAVQIAQLELAAKLVVIADPEMLYQRAKKLNLPLKIIFYDPHNPVSSIAKGQLLVQPIPLVQSVNCGHLNPNNAAYVLATLQHAVQGCLKKEFGALVTGPVHKGVINEAGISFSGHTEYLAQLTAASKVVMMLMTASLKVALVTTHLPLRAVADAITVTTLTETLNVLQLALQQYFSLEQPRILVCGLNPHAGEGGHIGREEIDIIIPTLEKLRQQGMNIIGPIPADTAFIPQNLNQADVVVTMYHDQGLPVLKYAGFDHAVNVTLGLPFIRTSVDHGTALDLAGTGKASAESLLAAIQVAAKMSGECIGS